MVHEGKLTVEGNADTGFRFLDLDGEPAGKPLRDPATTQVMILGPVGGEILAAEALASGNASSKASNVEPQVRSSGAEALSTADSCPKGDVISLGLTSDRRRTPGIRTSLSFETLPDSITAEEWRRMAPCFQWNERRRTLEWREEGRWVQEEVRSDGHALESSAISPRARPSRRSSASRPSPPA